jgi:hypothetical protein
MGITKADAVRAYAKMMNNLDASFIEPYLADDFSYESQWVFAEITSKQEYLDYIQPKLATIAKSGSRAFAEVALWADEPCVVMAQGSKDNLVATVLVKVSGECISRIDMCAVPMPQETRRTGEYPQ